MTDAVVEPFAVTTRSAAGDGTKVVVELSGELDLHSVEHVRSAVERVLAQRPHAIELDVSGVPFIDSGGLRALIVAQRDAEAAGIDFKLGSSSIAVDRVLDMTGMRALLYP